MHVKRHPRCPKCSMEITYLDVYATSTSHYSYNGDSYELEGTSDEDDFEEEYFCPYCGETVCVGHSNAEDFFVDKFKTKW